MHERIPIALARRGCESLRRDLLETAIPRHERVEHVRDQRRGINRIAVGLGMLRGVTFQIGFQRGGERNGDFDCLCLGREWPQPQLACASIPSGRTAADTAAVSDPCSP